jgi:hypothetical protein
LIHPYYEPSLVFESRSFNLEQYNKMALSGAPLHVSPSGQHIASGLPPMHPGFKSNISGGLLEHGANKTAASIKAQSMHAQKSGVTMRGSGKQRGGGLTQYTPGPTLEGNTIRGVSASANTGKLLQSLNGLKAGSVYDGLGNTTPYHVKIGGRKKRTKTNGRRKRRSHKRSSHKSHSRVRHGNRTKRRKN